MEYQTKPFSGYLIILCELRLGSVPGFYKCSFNNPADTVGSVESFTGWKLRRSASAFNDVLVLPPVCIRKLNPFCFFFLNFPGCTVYKNRPGDMSLSRSPWSGKIPHALGRLSLLTTTAGSKQTPEAHAPSAQAPQPEATKTRRPCAKQRASFLTATREPAAAAKTQHKRSIC